MKKILFSILVLTSLSSRSFAQSKTPAEQGGKFSIGLEGGLPVGDISTFYGSVIGASAKYDFAMSKGVFLTVSAGYNSFMLKSDFKDLGLPNSSDFIPVKAGLKYYASGNIFLEGQLGIVFSTESGGGHAFVYAPGIGYTLNGGFEAGLRYEGWSNNGTTSQVGLRIAYRF